MKIAVIGSGASASAVIAELACHADRRHLDVDLVFPETVQLSHGGDFTDPRQWSATQVDGLHRSIRQRLGNKFPPPKTHLGIPVDRLPMAGPGTLWRSFSSGGLSNFWSASMFPFTERDLDGWGIGRSDLDPYYARVAGRVGIAGEADSLDAYYGKTFANRPSVPVTRLLRRLLDRLPAGGDRTVSGVNRMGIETRPNHPRHCVGCGGCMYGCFRDSVYRSGHVLEELAAATWLNRRIATVTQVDRQPSGSFSLWTQDSQVLGQYDKVFLCAGALGTSEILMRSFGLSDLAIDDNELFVLPILSTALAGLRDEDYMAVANVVVGLPPTDQRPRFAQVHIAPFPEILVSYYFPQNVVRYLRPFIKLGQGRMLLAKLYIHSDTATRYELNLGTDHKLVAERIRRGASDEAARHAIADLRRALSGTGFIIPPIPLMKTATSSHYAGSLSRREVSRVAPETGEVMPGLHVCDSAAFPSSPAQPLTFTIMANATRITEHVMAG